MEGSSADVPDPNRHQPAHDRSQMDRCLNVDLWNVWGKIFMAALVQEVTGNVWVPWVMAAAMIVLELKSADLTEKQVQHMTGIPGVSVPHLILLDNIIMTPVDMLVSRIPGIDKLKTDPPQSLREKIGFLGEYHVIGFILGILLGVIGRFDLKGILQPLCRCHWFDPDAQSFSLVHGSACPPCPGSSC